MSEVLLFNHIPKTAGSTLKHVLWRVYGGDRVGFSMGFHERRLKELLPRLEGQEADVGAIVAHTGFGLHEWLPAQHRYPMITFLRDPVERTISSYWYHVQMARIEEGTSLARFLEHDVLRSFNVQTAFLAGLHARHHLDGLELSRDQFDRDLLERAKDNLRAHAAVGLTERFEESLLLVRRTLSWPSSALLHRSANVGALRSSKRLSDDDVEAVRANNELDSELYDFAAELFENQLGGRVPHAARRLAAFRGANAVYGRFYPALYAPAKSLVSLRRRVLSSSRRAA